MNQQIKTQLVTLNGQIQKVTKKLKTHHGIVIDVSGSMSSVLPNLRENLKANLPKFVSMNDTVSLTYFSSRGDFKTFIEKFEICDASDFALLNSRIDQNLRPRGCTGFVEPLLDTKRVFENIQKSEKEDCAFSTLFLTDGYDNEWQKKEILSATEEMAKFSHYFTIVEYGDYCNHNLLMDMKETANKFCSTNCLYAKNFAEYSNIFEKHIKNEIKTLKMKVIDVPFNNILDFCFKNENTYQIKDGKVSVPEDLDEVVFGVNPKGFLGYFEFEGSETDKYALCYHLAQRKDFDKLYLVLQDLGDKYMFNKTANSFGTDLLRLEKTFYDCISDKTLRFKDGFDSNLTIDKNQYCLLDLFAELQKDGNFWYPFDEKFVYRKIGSNISNNLVYTKEQQMQIDEIQEKLKEPMAFEQMKVLVQQMNDLMGNIESKRVKFEYKDKDKGYVISDVVWAMNKLNLSVSVTLPIVLTLPQNEFGIDKIESVTFRTYTFVLDGRKNIENFVVSLTKESFDILKSKNMVSGEFVENKRYELNIMDLPLISKSYAEQEYSAKKLLTDSYELLKLKATKRILDKTRKDNFVVLSKGLVEKYGELATQYLKDLGVTDGGYSPKVVKELVGDQRNITNFVVEIITNYKKDGSHQYLSLPSLSGDAYESIKTKIYESGKTTPNQELFRDGFNKLKEFEKTVEDLKKTFPSLNLDEQTLSDILSKNTKQWLDKEVKDIVKKTRELSNEISKTLFVIALTQSWFKDLPNDGIFKSVVNGFDGYVAMTEETEKY